MCCTWVRAATKVRSSCQSFPLFFDLLFCPRKTQVNGGSCIQKASWAVLVMNMVHWLPWNITLSGQLQKCVHVYWNTDILPCKCRWGYNKSNEQLNLKSKRLLTNNKSWRPVSGRMKPILFFYWNCKALIYYRNNCIIIVCDFSMLFWVFYSFQCATEMFSASKSA